MVKRLTSIILLLLVFGSATSLSVLDEPIDPELTELGQCKEGEILFNEECQAIIYEICDNVFVWPPSCYSCYDEATRVRTIVKDYTECPDTTTSITGLCSYCPVFDEPLEENNKWFNKHLERQGRTWLDKHLEKQGEAWLNKHLRKK
jgi:hypothetical protein